VIALQPEAATQPTPGPAVQLSWLEHLSELRRRLLIGLVALLATTIVAWMGYDHVISFMLAPYRHYLSHHSRIDVSGGRLVATAPLEGFTTRLRVSCYLGAALAAPVWIWEAWRFITPGLYRNERRYSAGFVVATVGLFGLGAATAVAVFPKAIAWMISVSGSGVVPLFSPARYLGLYAAACLVFGAVFTYPVFLVAMELTGIVTSARLRHWRRYAIVICCALAAVITPSSDPFSFVAMAVPMVVFYEAAILTGRALHR
jgi:sec-independent protein translocase protein TatC